MVIADGWTEVFLLQKTYEELFSYGISEYLYMLDPCQSFGVKLKKYVNWIFYNFNNPIIPIAIINKITCEFYKINYYLYEKQKIN